MNKNVTKLLATAMVVGLISGGAAMADHHKGHKGEKGDKKHDNGCGKKGGECKGHDKKTEKHETKEAGGTTTETTTTEEHKDGK